MCHSHKLTQKDKCVASESGITDKKTITTLTILPI